MAQNSTDDISFKILLLGDSSVGKTCFLKRYTDNTFQDAYLSTIGFDFKYKSITLKNGKTVKVQLWDTAGEERFRTIAKSYYRGAHGIILIYDVTNRKTFENIRKWLYQINEETSGKISILLIANKIDCVESRQVTKEEGKQMAKNNGLPIFEASAKDSTNVNESFQYLIEKISENAPKTEEHVQVTAKLNTSQQKKKNCC